NNSNSRKTNRRRTNNPSQEKAPVRRKGMINGSKINHRHRREKANNKTLKIDNRRTKRSNRRNRRLPAAEKIECRRHHRGKVKEKEKMLRRRRRQPHRRRKNSRGKSRTRMASSRRLLRNKQPQWRQTSL